MVYGSIGKEVVHFEAPPSSNVSAEMKQFLIWLKSTAEGGESEIKQAAVRSAITHLYFESIHPFEDGNGRFGRALAEKVLFESLGSPLLISISSVIGSNRNEYYEALKNAQRTNEVTEWVLYFLDVLIASQKQSMENIKFVLAKTKLFDRIWNQLNSRQLKVLTRC